MYPKEKNINTKCKTRLCTYIIDAVINCCSGIKSKKVDKFLLITNRKKGNYSILEPKRKTFKQIVSRLGIKEQCNKLKHKFKTEKKRKRKIDKIM